MSARVLLIGLGDLGRRLAGHLAGLGEVGELVLAGRPPRRAPDDGPAFAALLAACGTAGVRFAPVDATDEGAVERLLRRERPDLILQCATLLSPWALPGPGERNAGADRGSAAAAVDHRSAAAAVDHRSAAAAALASAGFALQLPAQICAVRTLLRAAATAGATAPVVNASYPDLTHPILAAEGLAPLVGIGNAGMILARVRAALRSAGRAAEPVRVVGHHAQVTPAILSRPPAEREQRPWVFLGEAGERADGLVYAEPPLRAERGLNALAAACALPLLCALLGGPPVRTSAPGPAGLPGGYPLRVTAGRVELDLPPGVSLATAVAANWRWARQDGVERVEADGTLHYTAQAQAAVAGIDSGLAEPLAIAATEERLQRLLRQVQGT